MAFSAVIPLMTVVNYSVQDSFGNNQFFWAGLEWFEQMLHDDRMWSALQRQLMFSGHHPGDRGAAGCLCRAEHAEKRVLGQLLPCRHVFAPAGALERGRHHLAGLRPGRYRLLGYTLDKLGIDYNYTQDTFDAWVTIIVMDVWHWTSLVALLAYAGLKSIPDAYYQAAKIDQASRWAVFRFIELPK